MTPTVWPRLLVMTSDLGLPDVAGLPADRIVHADGAPYLERYHLATSDATQVRIHHWVGFDDQRAPHDHPWDNITCVLAGRLVEYSAAFGVAELGPGDVVCRRAADPHRIELAGDDAWTLFVTGPIVRRWGFHTDTGWVHWRRWPGAGHYVT